MTAEPSPRSRQRARTPRSDAQLASIRAHRARQRERLLEQCKVVCNEPFRQRYLELHAEHRVTARGLAVEMGWTRKGHRGKVEGDCTRVRRALGLLCQRDSRMRAESFTKTVLAYAVAEKMAGLLGLDPQECGL